MAAERWPAMRCSAPILPRSVGGGTRERTVTLSLIFVLAVSCFMPAFAKNMIVYIRSMVSSADVIVVARPIAAPARESLYYLQNCYRDAEGRTQYDWICCPPVMTNGLETLWTYSDRLEAGTTNMAKMILNGCLFKYFWAWNVSG